VKSGLSVNSLAWKLLERLLENPEFYRVKIEKASSGSTIVDAGIKAKGGFQCGKIITEIAWADVEKQK